jgi:hypothetical protein
MSDHTHHYPLAFIVILILIVVGFKTGNRHSREIRDLQSRIDILEAAAKESSK